MKKKLVKLFSMLIFINFSHISLCWSNIEDNKAIFYEKQTEVIKLINTVGLLSKEKSANRPGKENAEYAYNGFMARFLSITNNQNNHQLQEMTMSLDHLSYDILKFLK